MSSKNEVDSYLLYKSKLFVKYEKGINLDRIRSLRDWKF